MKKAFLYLLVLAFLAAACGPSYEEKKRLTRAQQAQLKKEDSLALKVAVLPTLDCLPIYLAKEHRFFDTLKTDVRLRLYTAQMDCDTALANGRVEGSITDLIRGERLQTKGTPLRYVAATNTHWQFISNRTARVKEPKQLGDKMVAMTRYSATDYLTDLALDGVQTNATVFRIQINDIPLRLSMLINNEMDAMWLPEPQATTARLAKHPVMMDTKTKDIRLGAIAFRENALKDKRRQQQLNAFVKAYNRACDSINHYGTKEYADLIKKYCRVDDKTVEALPKMNFPHAAPPREADLARAKKK